MTIPYGTGRGAIDTTLVDLTDPWNTVIQSFRVDREGELTILTAAAGRQEIRRFQTRRGEVREVEQVGLPEGVGHVEDFLRIGDETIVSRLMEDEGTHAVFYRVRGDSILDAATLPRSARFNGVRGWAIANLGRLRRIGEEVWNCFPPNSSSVRVGTRHRLKPRLGSDDVVPGVPTLAGDLVWADAIQVAHGIHPILDLSAGGRGHLEEVFDDGGVVVRKDDLQWELKKYEFHAPDGSFRARVVVPATPASGYHVGDGESTLFLPGDLYQLRFEREGVVLIRYRIR